MNGQSRDTGNTGHKTRNEDNTQKTKKQQTNKKTKNINKNKAKQHKTKMKQTNTKQTTKTISSTDSLKDPGESREQPFNF